jgi:hypothetical protein
MILAFEGSGGYLHPSSTIENDGGKHAVALFTGTAGRGIA